MELKWPYIMPILQLMMCPKGPTPSDQTSS